MCKKNIDAEPRYYLVLGEKKQSNSDFDEDVSHGYRAVVVRAKSPKKAEEIGKEKMEKEINEYNKNKKYEYCPFFLELKMAMEVKFVDAAEI